MELSLSVILRIFLIFGVFEPSYSYKPYSYKKNRCITLFFSKNNFVRTASLRFAIGERAKSKTNDHYRK